MIFYNPTLPTLQQMSLVVIAVKLGTDLEVKALTKKYEHASFLIPSKEMHIFLNKKLPNYIPPLKSYGLLIHKSNYRLLSNYSFSEYFPDIPNSGSNLHINEHRFTENNLPCMMWEELISKKISSLPLPNSMNSKLMTLIRCICIEIDQWQKEHEHVFRFQCIDLLRYFCWNTQGKIDRVKTAKSLVNDESLCITERYNLAQLYFFVSESISLWEKLPLLFKLKVKCLPDYDDQKVWYQYITTKKDASFNGMCLISWYNTYNLRAYLSFLKQNEKKDWFRCRIQKKRINYEDLCLYLSLLERNEQELVLRKFASNILQHYLVPPLQNEFLDVLKSLWPFISIENYIDILNFIIYERIMIGWKDFDYVGLLKEFWMQTPNNFKEILKNHEVYQNILPVISYELDNSFPNEVILENYKGDYLKFHHGGISYRISKMTSPLE
ncbi:uncharacterized protein TNIN_189001 [Trichonephila inaurata madagascariensis]|uniref:Uncharacterized protein n=1 Tax=Trichonephila inaurata madagascariensis TaxID=2747483 RepID=A0A8X6XEG3_9ARAC|nr:uncharacterized protein TNIN_189001 [Trichonephila inaurata madagascariensis]